MIASRKQSAHLRVITDMFPGLQGLEKRSSVTTTAETRMRRIRMEMEDQSNAIRLPILPSGRES